MKIEEPKTMQKIHRIQERNERSSIGLYILNRENDIMR
jgi:hypothetical protein